LFETDPHGLAFGFGRDVAPASLRLIVTVEGIPAVQIAENRSKFDVPFGACNRIDTLFMFEVPEKVSVRDAVVRVPGNPVALMQPPFEQLPLVG
jgi:hypothetical protein